MLGERPRRPIDEVFKSAVQAVVVFRRADDDRPRFAQFAANVGNNCGWRLSIEVTVVGRMTEEK